MRYKRLSLVVLICIFVMFTGCMAKEKTKSINTKERVEVDYSILKKGEAPEHVAEYLSARAGEAYTECMSEAGYTYAIISFGNQATSGYSIRIDEVSEGNRDIGIKAKLVAPAKDAKVNQVTTCPYVILKLEDKGKEVNINIGGNNDGAYKK